MNQKDRWQHRLNNNQSDELLRALDFFKVSTEKQGLTAQWLHGN